MIMAQDAVKADPKHYSVISENAQVRILKVHYGPHEKSVMHSHPASVAVFLTDANGVFSFPGGKKQDFAVKAGQAQYDGATTHLPENTGDAGMDVIVIELKGHAAKPAKTAMK
jgi:quercetin dioxygenase-like cupin family protein